MKTHLIFWLAKTPAIRQAGMTAVISQINFINLLFQMLHSTYCGEYRARTPAIRQAGMTAVISQINFINLLSQMLHST